MFTGADVRTVAKVAIIGKTVADKLYTDGNALGQVLRIKGVPFIVVGVLVPKGLSVMGNDQDDVVIIPYTSCMKRLFGATTLRPSPSGTHERRHGGGGTRSDRPAAAAAPD